ncbi:MAG: hypothetical protein IJW40_08530 [Clostridia bacterium]|nr:hypothetical protein [Clostridia bacterium]
MMKIKLLSMILALVLSLSMLMSACANDTDPADDPDIPDTSDGSEQNGDKQDDPEEEKPFDIRAAMEALPECTFAGDEFLIAASSTYENVFTIDQFATDDQKNGSLVHDSLFDRDALVEEIFGITLVYDDMLDSAMYNKIGNSIRSGDDTYSLVLGAMSSVALNMFNNNLLYDINEVPHIDLSQPWWNENSIDNFQINDKIYMATGAITNRYVYSPYAVLFNQQLIDDAALDSPYELLENNEWTLEVFAEMIEDTYRDLNANDAIDLEDFYGLAPASDSETAWYFAAGATLLDKVEDELIFTYLDDNNTIILEEVLALYDSDNVLQYEQTYDSIDAFREGRAIFHSMALCDITMLNDMEDEYGIVPMPKYDSYQETFYSNANRYISTMALLPSSIVDIDNVGLIIEGMAMTSQYTSLDKQYEQVLLNRQALDAQSKASLITVVESTTYDLCYAFDMAGMPERLRPVIKSAGSYASFYAGYESQLESALEDFMEHYE